MEMSPKDQLPSPRLPLEMTIEYRRSYARQIAKGTLKNISLTGAFLMTPEAVNFNPFDKVVVTFSVSGRRRKMTAAVVWQNDLGCGIRFEPYNNRDLQIVDDLMYFVENSRESRRNVFEDILKRVS